MLFFFLVQLRCGASAISSNMENRFKVRINWGGFSCGVHFLGFQRDLLHSVVIKSCVAYYVWVWTAPLECCHVSSVCMYYYHLHNHYNLYILFHHILYSSLQGKWPLVVDQIIYGMKNCPSVLKAKRLWLENRVSVIVVYWLLCIFKFFGSIKSLYGWSHPLLCASTRGAPEFFMRGRE